MKVVIIIVTLAIVVISVTFVFSLIGVAAAKSAWEQMLEDEEQVRYIKEWYEKKHLSARMHNISGHGSVQNAEPENNHGKMADGRGLSGQKE